VKLLLDTHALLWWLADVELGDPARRAVADPTNLVAVSAASVWEASITRAIGKLDVPEGLAGVIEAAGFDPLPVTARHAEAAGALPAHHRDPFDRMLVAQAQAEGLTVVSRNAVLDRYGVPRLAC
jgi:PIN domain nuclease of toxin-antitoxin system